MDFVSYWHWVLLLPVLAVLYFHILFILRSRKLILAEPPANQFFYPNLTWLCLVPMLNIIWIPLTVFAVEKTISKGNLKSVYFDDRILVTCGRLLKYWLPVLIGLQFFRYLIVYYLPELFPTDEQSLGSNLIWAVLNVFDVVFYLVLLGMYVSIIWYPVRLVRLINKPFGN